MTNSRSYISQLQIRRHISKGNRARDARDWSRAAAAYGLALEMSPDLAPIWVQYGHMLKESGDKEAASKAYDRALALEPGVADTHLQVGHLRKLQNDLDGAAASYARAHELDPEMEDAVRELQALGRVDLTRSPGASLSESSAATPDHGAVIDPGRIDAIEAKIEALSSQFPTFLEHMSITKALSFQIAESRSLNDRRSSELKTLENGVESIRLDLANRDGAALVTSQATNRRLDSVDNRIEDITRRAERIAAQLVGLLDQLSAASDRAGEHSAKLKDTMRDLRAQSGRLDGLSNALADSSARLGVQSARLDAVGERTIEQSAKLETYAATVHTQVGKLSALETQVGAQSATLEGCVEKVGSQFGRLEGLGSRLAEHSASIDALLKDLGAHSGTLERFEGLHATHSAALKKLLERMAGHEGKLGDLERRSEEFKAVVDAVAELNGGLAEVADKLEVYRLTAARGAAELTALRLTENERYTELRADIDRFVGSSLETQQYLLGRVEFVRRELLYEFRYGGRKTEHDAALSVKSKVINEERYEDSIRSGSVVLNVGCGHIIEPDCLNVDRRELPGVDLIAEADDLPFERGTVDEIRSSHLLEHFPQEALVRDLLPYWHGLLKPGGKLRAIAPDGDAMLSEHASGRYPFDDLREVLYGAQDYDGDFHFNLLTPSTLRAILEVAGFKQIELVESGRRNGRCFEFEIEAIA